MKRNIATLVLFASTLAIVVAPLGVRAEQPAIIDRSLFFGDDDIAGERISPDGQFVSFLRPYRGTRNIWVKRTSEPFSAARPVSAETRPVGGDFWSQDSKFILFAQDAGGGENFNVYAIDPTLAAEPATGVPPTRARTGLQGVRTMIYSLPRAKPDIIHIGLNDRDARWRDLHELHLSTGEKTLLRKNTERIDNWVFDHAGALRLAVRLTETEDQELLRVDPDGLKVIYSCDVLESCGQEGFDADNRLLYLVTNRGTSNLTELQMLDPATGATTAVYAAAVDIVGPSNLVTELELTPAYWEAAKKAMYTRIADPTTAEGKARDCLERFPFRLTVKSYTESALDSMSVAFPLGKPVSTFPGNALVAADGGPGQERSAGQYPQEQSDCRRIGRPRKAARISPRPRRGPRLCTADQQSCDGLGRGTLSGKVSRRPPPGGCPGRRRSRVEEMRVDPATLSGAVTLKQTDANPSK